MTKSAKDYHIDDTSPRFQPNSYINGRIIGISNVIRRKMSTFALANSRRAISQEDGAAIGSKDDEGT